MSATHRYIVVAVAGHDPDATDELVAELLTGIVDASNGNMALARMQAREVVDVHRVGHAAFAGLNYARASLAEDETS